MISYFEDLGRRIERAWVARDVQQAELPALCLEQLLARPPSDHLGIDDVIRIGFGERRLPDQLEIGSAFGQPPLTLFDNGRFYISVLFWLDSTTCIHEHNFVGAFHVLHGGSIHTTFAFEPSLVINEYMQLGTLRQGTREVLKRGDSREIRSAGGTIHSLFHLERPSATVVVRTRHAAISRPQYSYFRGGVACCEEFDSVDIKRRLDLMTLLHAHEPAKLPQMVRGWLESTDFTSAFLGLRHVVRMLSPEQGDEFLAGTNTRHAGLPDVVRRVIEEERREQCIIRRRAVTSDAALRFFLAVLLNAQGRDDGLALVRSKFPDNDPIDLIVSWVAGLGKAPPVDPGDASALGIAVDEITLTALRELLEGRSKEEVSRSLLGAGLIRANEIAVAEDLCAALAGSEFFRNLLASSVA